MRKPKDYGEHKNYWAWRYANDPEFRAKKLAQRSRTPEDNQAYMREYYERNKEKWPKRTAEQQAKHNATRRTQYAQDTEIREKLKAQSREWYQQNPDKRRDQHYKQFGISLVDYNRMLAEQNGGCAICGASASIDVDHRTGKQRRLHVDHCHRTGVVRGLLCSSCNLGIGKLGDDPDRLERAAMYLRKARLRPTGSDK